MLTGLLNQTAGGNWWQGNSAPTSGYGSFDVPPQPAQEEAPPPIASDPIGGTPAAPAQPAASAQPAPTADQQRNTILNETYTKQMQQHQLTLNQLQTQLGYYQPGSMDYSRKQSQINNVLGQIRDLQMKISNLQV